MGPTMRYNLSENPPESPFGKGGLSKGFRKVPSFANGGIGGIYIKGTVNKNWHLIPDP